MHIRVIFRYTENDSNIVKCIIKISVKSPIIPVQFPLCVSVRLCVCARVFISTALIHQIIQIEVFIKKSIKFNTAQLT